MPSGMKIWRDVDRLLEQPAAVVAQVEDQRLGALVQTLSPALAVPRRDPSVKLVSWTIAELLAVVIDDAAAGDEHVGAPDRHRAPAIAAEDRQR